MWIFCIPLERDVKENPIYIVTVEKRLFKPRGTDQMVVYGKHPVTPSSMRSAVIMNVPKSEEICT